LVSWMLSGTDKDISTQHVAIERMQDSPPGTLDFFPGTLSLSHVDTLMKCHADPKIYRGHLKQGDKTKTKTNVRVSYSKKHKLALVMLPKSGSSTARYHLKNDFDGTEKRKSLQHEAFKINGTMEGVSVMSFVRDPLSRFYSQYEEAFVRTAPWVNDRPDHPFPFMHEGLNSYHEYEDVFCLSDTRNSRKDCTFRESQENGTLKDRFERFVREWDGLSIFDVHLVLQVPLMSTSSGEPLHITQLYNTTDAKRSWERIAEKYNVTLGSKGVIKGRSYPRRFKSELVSKEIQRRICELTLLDYCCLNLPLPEVCRRKQFKGSEGGENRELMCQLNSNGRILPATFPKKLGNAEDRE